MNQKLWTLGAWCVLALTALPVFPVRAATIFDNSSADLRVRFEPGPVEVADEIQLAGTERYLTSFSFEYWGLNDTNPAQFAGQVEARVRFYLNDGADFNGYATPGQPFWDSDWFSIAATERNVLVFRASDYFPEEGVFLAADRLSWSVQFRGLEPTDHAGVDLYSPAGVGGQFPDYWEHSAAGWELKTNWVAMNFAARLEAKPPRLHTALTEAGPVVSWPVSASNYVLETSATLGAGAGWTQLTNEVARSGEQLLLHPAGTGAAGFFRLRMTHPSGG